MIGGAASPSVGESLGRARCVIVTRRFDAGRAIRAIERLAKTHPLSSGGI